jgi:hypothetical protein
MVGKPAEPLQVKRDEPGVVLCMSERVGSGIRIVGKLNEGIYPVTRVTLEYRLADASDAVPAIPGPGTGGMQLTEPRTAKGTYRKGSKEVSYTIDDARSLRDKVIWYRWNIAYDRGGTEKIDATSIHRTSIDEAGLPRSIGTPGPDASVALPTTRRR